MAACREMGLEEVDEVVMTHVSAEGRVSLCTPSAEMVASTLTASSASLKERQPDRVGLTVNDR